MSRLVKLEYGAAAVLAIALHSAVVLSFDTPPQGNAPLDGYILEFSLGAYGGAEAVAPDEPIEVPDPEPVESIEDIEETVQELTQTEPEPLPPEPEPVVEQVEADFSLKKEESVEPEPEPESEPIKEERVEVKPRVTPQPVVKPKPEPKPIEKKVSQPAPEPVEKSEKDSPVTVKAPEVTGAKAHAETQTLGGGGTDERVTSGVSGGIRGVRAHYMTLLHKYLSRYKSYPRRARTRRQEGTSVVEFTLSNQGAVQSARIQTSSGHKLLDKEALAMLKRAQPLPRPPGALGSGTMKFILPIPFSLR